MIASDIVGEFRGTSRFELLDRIGRGAMGVVYRAHDRERDAVVALKLLQRADPEALLRFKREFRALGDVTHHNLVALHELVADGDEWFFTMELVNGVDFLTYVRGGPPAFLADSCVEGSQSSDDEADLSTADTMTLPHVGRDMLDGPLAGTARAFLTVSHIAPPAVAEDQLQRLRDGLRQLVHGVVALHQAGQLHRDIKPSNVLVDTNDRVVVLDFGVVADLTARDQSSEFRHRLVGTPAYMAPEQGTDTKLAAAADWYSVGVMLYEALTGRRPFVGAGRDVIEAKRLRDPQPPVELAGSVPPDLSSLCMRMLLREPGDRPTDSELVRIVGGGRGSQPSIATRHGLGESEPRLVGRAGHMMILREAYAAIRRGEPRTVFVHGTSGVGKTALLNYFLDELRKDGEAVILSGRCYERESVPYKALDALLDGLCHHLAELPRRDVWALMPKDAHALTRLFPSLRQVEAVLGASRSRLDNLDPHDLRRRSFTALRQLLTGLAVRAPLILYIDDLQWGDTDSAALLQHLTRQPDAPPVMLIGAYRREDVKTSKFLRALLPEQPGAVSLSIDPLTVQESSDLAVSLLGPAGVELEHLVRSIARESGGNPFFVGELAGYVQRTTSAGDDFSLGVISLDEVLMAQVVDLPVPARALLEIVAVAGRPVSQAVAIGAAALRADEQAAVAALRNANLVRTRGARDRDDIECFHDRIRVAVVSHLPEERLRACHERLGTVLESSGEADPETLTYHFEGAGDLERAGTYCVQAADLAADALAFERATALYRRALSLRTTDNVEAARLNGRLGEALANVGRRSEAAAAFMEAARTAKPADVLEYRRRAGEELLLGGHIDEGVHALQDVLEDVGLKLSIDRRRVMFGVTVRRVLLRLRGLGYRARDASELSVHDLRRLEACWTASVGFGMCDNVRGADFQTRHLLYALRAGERRHIARALTVEAAFTMLGSRGSERRAFWLCDKAQSIADEIDDPVERAWAIGVRGLISYQAGRFREALQATTESERSLADYAGQYWEIETLHLYQVWSLYYLCELRELARRVPELLRNAQDRGDLYAATNMSTGWPNAAWLVVDDVDTARSVAREMMGRWSRQGYHLQHHWDVLGRAQADLYTGDAARALRRVQDGIPQLSAARLTRSAMVLVESQHMLARAALATAAATRSDAERRRLLELAWRAAGRIDRRELAFCRPLAALVRAGCRAVSGDEQGARELLEVAIAAGTEAQMATYAIAARHSLGCLLGGSEGGALRAEAEGALRDQGVVNPRRMLRIFAPGFG